MFYPEATERQRQEDGTRDQYVDDRPYAASSFSGKREDAARGAWRAVRAAPCAGAAGDPAVRVGDAAGLPDCGYRIAVEALRL